MSVSIVLDLDGVIADIATSIEDALLYAHGINKGDYDYSHWLTTHHECDLSNNIMANYEFWLNMKPFEDAWHQVNKWFNSGADVYVVTARRTDHSMSVTERWLDEWKINTMKPIFAKMGEKHDIVNDINPLFVVEDNPNEVMTLAKEGHHAFLRKAWYNRQYWGEMPSINSLLELEIND